MTAVTALVHLAMNTVLKRTALLDIFRAPANEQKGTSILRKDLTALHARVTDVGQFLTQIESRIPKTPPDASPNRSDELV